MALTHVLIQPLITEKSLEATKANRYTFVVTPSATKGQIKEAVEKYFQVEVARVHTVMNRGQQTRTGRRRLPKITPDTKKAVVTLKKGQSISIFETKS